MTRVGSQYKRKKKDSTKKDALTAKFPRHMQRIRKVVNNKKTAE
jgi:hypothetical protein